MGVARAWAGVFVASVAAFLVGRRTAETGRHHLRIAGDPVKVGVDATFFAATPGTGGFCKARINDRMRGRAFVWRRVGSCTPPAGGRFEIRPKEGQVSPLIPERPAGVDFIFAQADPSVLPGTIYCYGLWEVHADGSAKELDDPELEIGI